MKVLYYGGQKSGKSRLAEKKALLLEQNKKPYYIATYNNSYEDKEMQERLKTHQKQRANLFETIEEPLELKKVIQENQTYLIDCISMWILNTLNEDIEKLLRELEHLGKSSSNIVFVLNNVNEGIIPLEAESRKFVDRTGVIGQKLAEICDEVYEVKLGIEGRLK